VFVTQPAERALYLAGAGTGINAGAAAFTANGVVYASSTSALATGSALTFDGSSLVGTGKFQSQVMRIKDAAYSELYFSTADAGGAGALSYEHSTNTLKFYANSAERMTLTSSLLSVVPGATIQGLTVGRGAGAVSTNTAVGASALAGNTSGVENTAIGAAALTLNTTGFANVALGDNTLRTNLTGEQNTALGHNVLYLATGSFNTGAGSNTLRFNTTGINNTAFGFNALFSNETASNNTAFGYQAGYSNLTGAEMTAVGVQAMYFNQTGAENSAFGRQALYSNVSGSNNVAIGLQSLRNNTAASNNTAIGYQAGFNTTAANNISIGFQAGYNVTSATGTVAIGIRALGYGGAGVTGSQNIGIGDNALYNQTSGLANTAIGGQALYSNTTASNNTAVGYQALYANTTASQNTAVGYEAGLSNLTGTYNTYLGWAAGRSHVNTTSAGSVLVGAAAGYNMTTAGHNTFIGVDSGGSITTGSKNSILGRYNGNQGGLDIRTASNYIVLSDGDGNPRLTNNASAWSISPTFPAWSDYGAMQYSDGAGVYGYLQDELGVFTNAYYNSGWKYRVSSKTASWAYAYQGSYYWNSVDAGTAGAAITWTQIMGVAKGSTLALQGATPQAGTGITFPATQAASTNANTLDDYEEGTWTPTDASGAVLTFTSVGGEYTKIGRQIIAYFMVTFPSTASSGQITIGGLPYNSASSSNVANPGSGGFTYQTASISNVTMAIAAGGAQFNFWTLAGAAVPNSSASTFTLRGWFQYFTNT
jgi:hypothetical protein